MTVWLTFFGAGLATLGLRYVPARLLADRPLSERWDRALAFVGPAAFAALAAPALALAPAAATPALARLAAVVATIGVVRKTGSVAAAVVAGLAIVWVLP
jgi:branched-subunit amino acid transport protein